MMAKDAGRVAQRKMVDSLQGQAPVSAPAGVVKISWENAFENSMFDNLESVFTILNP